MKHLIKEEINIKLLKLGKEHVFKSCPYLNNFIIYKWINNENYIAYWCDKCDKLKIDKKIIEIFKDYFNITISFVYSFSDSFTFKEFLSMNPKIKKGIFKL